MMYRKVWFVWAAVMVAVLSTMGAACNKVADVNPIAAGCSKEVDLSICGYASYGTFVIFQEQGLKIALDLGLPDKARQAIVTADEIAKPVADSLYAALLEYENVRAALAAGNSTEAKLAIATRDLNQWITAAAPLVRDLVKAVMASAAKG